MGVWYTTRETVKASLDIKRTARSNAQVDKAIEAASRSVEGLLHRRFYPELDTRYFDWPGETYSRAWRLWLDEHEVVSISSLVAGGVTIDSTDYFLEPVNNPPYDRVEIDLASDAFFEVGDTHQRDIAVTGVFAGCPVVDLSAGTLAAVISSTSETSVTVSDSSVFGVGNILKAEDERMLVTGKTMIDSAQNTGGNLTASQADVTVSVSDGSAFNIDEVILVESERMLIVEIAGNSLTVIRAWDGSVLASHSSGADIYWPRQLTVTRGALGTTAATHSNGTAISRYEAPGTVEELCIAYAINNLLQRQAGYARVAGEGDNAREYTGRGIRALEADAIRRYGRKARTGAV